jgi:hypothetical protein
MVPIVAIVGGITFAIVSVISKNKTRQLEIQQRIAMIEKGLVPPPETDPRGFERAMSWAEGHRQGPGWRHRRGGIILIGIGFGLMLLIGLNGSFSRGIGVGGFIALIGLALLINSLLERRDHSSSQPPPSTQPPLPPAGS